MIFNIIYGLGFIIGFIFLVTDKANKDKTNGNFFVFISKWISLIIVPLIYWPVIIYAYSLKHFKEL